MAFQVNVRIEGTEELQRTLDAISPSQRPRVYRSILLDIALRTQRIAVTEKIARGGTGPPLPDKLTSRTGNLRRSIRTSSGRNFADVGSDVIYAGVHEFGIPPFPPRPYLQPAAEDVVRQVPEIVSRRIQREIDRA